MLVTTDQSGDMSCDISAKDQENIYVGAVKYKNYEVGSLTDSDLSTIRKQFAYLCDLVDNQGAMVRHNSVMTGYHNDDLKGDVLTLDGEVLGSWHMDPSDDWCFFKLNGEDECVCVGPSPWLLHDSIAEWMNKRDDSKER